MKPIYDKATEKWFREHIGYETTVMQCEECGLWYKPILGHKCKVKKEQKQHLPTKDCLTFPATFDEFAEAYKIVDSKEIYTNGAELIPIFRVKQWLEHQELKGGAE
jgi:hypothetical protein